jgi:hypothetical protein
MAVRMGFTFAERDEARIFTPLEHICLAIDAPRRKPRTSGRPKRGPALEAVLRCATLEGMFRRYQRSMARPSNAPAAAGINTPATYQTARKGAASSGQCSA